MHLGKIQQYGDELHQAYIARQTIAPLLDREPELNLADAYRIQQRMIYRRLEAGETIVGKKIAAATRMPLRHGNRPDFGQLTSGMLHREGEEVSLGRLIQPRVAAEVAFVLKRDLLGPGITAADVLRATEYVAPCFEIIDSRISGGDAAPEDSVADNASCGVFLLGNSRAKPGDLQLSLASMISERNGAIFYAASGAEAQACVIQGLISLANALGESGLPLRAGEFILSGSHVAQLPAIAGDTLRCTVDGLGSCQIHFIQ